MTRLKAEDKAVLYRELAKLIGADFHLDRSVDMLLGQRPPTGRREYLEGLKRGLARGEGIAKAVETELGPMVTGMELTLIKSGERSGRMAEAFAHLARYFSAIETGIRQARGAMIYPLILIHLGIILPAVPAAVANEGTFSLVSGILVPLIVFWVFVAVVWWIWRMLAAAAIRSASVDGMLNTIPLVGNVRSHWALARFSQVFHAGLLAALRMSEITRMSGDASQSGKFLEGSEAAAKKVEGGASLSGSLRETGAFPGSFVDGVATAEEAGALDREFARWAELETDLAGEATKRAAEWLPRIAYGLVMFYVAWRIISTVMGIYSPIMKQIDSM